MPGSFSSPMPMKPLLAPPLPVSSIPLSTISLPLESSKKPANYEIFDDSEELLKSERFALQQPVSLYPIIPPS